MDVDQQGGAQAGEIDDELGVAVVFDEEEEEEEQDDQYEIKDDDDDDMDDDEANTLQQPVDYQEDGGAAGDESPDEEEGFKTVLPGESERKKKAKLGKTQSPDYVAPHDVDAFWLQRHIATYYSDPHEAQEKTIKAFEILGAEAISVRDCENELMGLFDYDKFDLVRILIKNRDAIYWCTRLARVTGDDKIAVEKEIQQRNLGWILRDISGDRKGTSAMDVDEQGKRTDHRYDDHRANIFLVLLIRSTWCTRGNGYR
jgi:pre-mRNA-splicing helicase BRR2